MILTCFILKCPVCSIVKESHAQMPLAMANIAKQELDQLPDYIQSCSLVYIPEIGFLLAIKFWKPDLTDEELLQLENVTYKVSLLLNSIYSISNKKKY